MEEKKIQEWEELKSALNTANTRGAFELHESARIVECIKVLEQILKIKNENFIN